MWLGGGITGMGGIPMLGVKKKVEPIEPEPTVPEPDPFTPLFANNEQGFFYDPNDLSTMFQDAAGTIPVTGTGQPVGLIRDKSGNGNHAFQMSSASRPILQQTPKLGNELVVNGHFSDNLDGWQFQSATATVENGRARVTHNGGGGIFQDVPVTVGKTYKVSKKSQNISGSSIFLYVYDSENTSIVLGSTANDALYITPVSSSIRVYLYKGGYGTSSWDDISVKEITGYRTDQNYLVFDGVDDFLRTSKTDFTGTDKVSLFIGLQKLSDSNHAILCEFTPSWMDYNGTFAVFAPSGNGSPNYTIGSKLSLFFGTSQQAVSSNNFKAPISNILTIKHFTKSELWIDGVLNKTADGAKGAGNYGNYPLYIGRRGGITGAFNGCIYGLIGVGRLTAGDETAAIEKELANRTGVTLNV